MSRQEHVDTGQSAEPVVTDATTTTPEPRRIRSARELATALPPWTGVGVLTLAGFMFLSVKEPNFLQWQNLMGILSTNAGTLLLAVGTTFLLVAGIIDLSIGSILALDAMILAGTMANGWPVVVAIILMVLCSVGISAGLVGVLITKMKLNFFVVGLGGLSLLGALASLPTDGNSISIFGVPGSGIVGWFGYGTILQISVPAIISIGSVFAGMLVLRFTNFGRSLFAVGGNRVAARLGGIPVDRVVLGAFAINGILIALAALVYVGQAQLGSPAFGLNIVLNVVAAVLLGGTSFTGGSATMFGTFVGVLFLAVLQNGLVLAGVTAYWQSFVSGAVLLAAVGIDRLRVRARGGAETS